MGASFESLLAMLTSFYRLSLFDWFWSGNFESAATWSEAKSNFFAVFLFVVCSLHFCAQIKKWSMAFLKTNHFNWEFCRLLSSKNVIQLPFLCMSLGNAEFLGIEVHNSWTDKFTDLKATASHIKVLYCFIFDVNQSQRSQALTSML